MSYVKGFFVTLLVLGNMALLFSNNTAEYNRAMQYLKERGEVCFNFYIDSPSELQDLANVISIDKITSNQVFAYANAAEFSEFLKYEYYYEVKTPPGLLTEVEGSDYSDYLEKGLPTEWDKYPTHSAYINIMEKFQTDYPDLCEVEQFGTSVNGKKLMVAKISDNVSEEEKEPKFFYQSTIHGDETAPWIMMLNLIEHLCKDYNSDARVKKLVDNIEIWINPLANPDGTYGTGDQISSPRRYNANNKDLNRDFPFVNLERDGGNYTPWNRGQPETNATVDLGDENTFTMSADFHGGTELVCYIWGMSGTNHADKTWWQYVGSEWADLAQDNSPSGYFTAQGGCLNCYQWYQVQGERMNHAGHKQHCRDLTVEVSTSKFLSESRLIDYWGYQKESIMTYLEQVLYGIHGTVTDLNTGDPLEDVEVFVENHDVNNSQVFTDKFGGFYRPIQSGTHDLTFSLQGYEDKTVENVSVTNKQTTTLDVQLWDGSTGADISTVQTKPAVSMVPFGKGIKIQCENSGKITQVGIYNLDGSLVQLVPVQKNIVWDGKNSNGYTISNGCYIVKLIADKQVLTKSFVLSH